MELNAQIKPFGFDNGPDRPHSRCLNRSLSSPQINLSPEPAPTKSFKASPVPKANYSNYFQTKMTEEEYFRNMNKRVRAEELLKMATLPPSMKRREKGEKKRFELHSCSSQSTKRPKRKRKTKKSRISSSSTTKTSHSSNFSGSGTKDEFITTCPHPFDLMTSKRPADKERLRKAATPTPTTSSSKSSFSFKTQIPTPSPLYPVNRPNLAATLRYEHSRNKIQELKERSASSLAGSVRPFRWNVQKTPGWQSLAMDPTHAEELQLRLATRRAEQKLRQEEYKMSKELMIQRVKAAPLLLEGPSFWGPKVGQLSHHCGTENEKGSRCRPGSSVRRPTSSKMSNYSDSKDSKGSTTTMGPKIIDLSGKQSTEYDDDFYDNSNSEIE